MGFRCTLAPKPGSVANPSLRFQFGNRQASPGVRLNGVRVPAYAVMVERLHAVEAFAACRALAAVAGELQRVTHGGGVFSASGSGWGNTIAGIVRGAGNTGARGQCAPWARDRARVHAAFPWPSMKACTSAGLYRTMRLPKTTQRGPWLRFHLQFLTV